MPRSVRLAAALALILLARAASPPPATAAEVAWARPVPGGVARTFVYDAGQPFTRGQHRGVDLAAAPGATVRAACAGRVVTARAGQVVTLRCGPWRVTHLPMARVAVRLGERVDAGARVGTLGSSRDHHGLHLGVRRAGDPFGYVDPLAFLPRARPRPPVPPLPAPDRARPRAPVPQPPPARIRGARRVPHPALRRVPASRVAGAGAARRLPAPLPVTRLRGAGAAWRLPPALPGTRVRGAGVTRPVPAPLAASRVAGARAGRVRVSPPGGLAPWPAWAGLVLVLCGGLGGGVRWRVRVRRVRTPARAREGVA